jgi:sterol desaturase/sphingolipid hydroxylase (fatty acid hydroxylase superfamily)
VLLAIELTLLFPIGMKIIPIQDPIIFAFFWIGFGLGYLAYDLTHYSLHFVDTSRHKGSFFHKLQKYHNQHHFGGEEAGFGVSSPLWDYIIGTTFKQGYKKA